MNDEFMEVSDELPYDEVSDEEVQEVTSSDCITLQDIEILNNNIISGFLYVTGALGIIVGLMVGFIFHGIFRSK